MRILIVIHFLKVEIPKERIDNFLKLFASLRFKCMFQKGFEGKSYENYILRLFKFSFKHIHISCGII